MGNETIAEKLKNITGLDRILVLFVLGGVILAGVSFLRGILVDRQVQVEVLKDGDKGNEYAEVLLVDVEGAVMSPGVYQLSEGSRLKDALILAGGLSGDADRSFCEKNLNMASLISDGQKIYIPAKSGSATVVGYSESVLGQKTVSLNYGTVSELDTLWGIGESRAESIVKNRPYQSIDDLVSKGVLPKSVVEKIRESVSVY